jgi:uncharacterized delta-60 repeat protein
VITALACYAAALPAGASAATSSGTPASTFGTAGDATVAVGSWAAAAADVVQPNGQIVTAGETDLNGTDEILVTRMNADGSRDSTFGTGGIVTVNINGSAGVDSGAGLVLQSNGDIVVAGTGSDGKQDDFAAVRLLPSGAVDPSFGKNGVVTVPIGSYSIANAVLVQPNGDIVLGGDALLSGHSEFAVARLLPNGAVDTHFGTNGYTTFSPAASAWGMVLQSNGDIVLGGQEAYGSNAQQFMATRVTSTGAVDTSFGSKGIVSVPIGATAIGMGIAIQSNGQLLLTGSAYTNTSIAAVVRLNTNGAVDRTFGSAGVASVTDWYGVNAITLDPSGRILLGGVGSSVVRFNANGSVDNTFGTGGLAMLPFGSNGGAANGIAVDPATGQILLGGTADIGGQTEVSVIRVNP